MKTTASLRTFFAAATLLISQTALAQQAAAEQQTSSFHAGEQTLALGFGLGIRYGYPPNTAIAPAVMLVYDVGIGEGFGGGTFGVGGVVAVKTARYDPIPFYAGPAYRARWSNFLVAARVSYHFALSGGFEGLDLYTGAMAGFRYESYRQTTSSGPGGAAFYAEEASLELQPVVGLFGGARYDFTPRIGAWLEVGYDVSLIKTGMHVNL